MNNTSTISEVTEARLKAHKSLYTEEFINGMLNNIKDIDTYVYDVNEQSITIYTTKPNNNIAEEFESVLKSSVPTEYKKYIIKGVFFNTMKCNDTTYIIMI